jgi:hypothetical protein
MIKQVMPFVVGLFLCTSLHAQVPKQINYQGIARNASGVALGNQSISLRLTVREGNPNGAVVYQEVRKVETNQFGLFSTAIGSQCFRNPGIRKLVKQFRKIPSGGNGSERWITIYSIR